MATQRQSRVVRFLGGLTFFEGVVTALAATWAILGSGEWAASFRAEGPGAWPVAYAAVSATLFLGLALAASGRLLWEGKAEGLAWLAVALACELEVVGLPAGLLTFGLDTPLATAAVGTGAAAACMTLQAVTAYPLLAVVLMYPAYKQLVPCGPLRGGVAAAPEPAEGARPVLRALAWLTLIEVVGGLVSAGPALRAVQRYAGDPWFRGYPHVQTAAYAAAGVNVVIELALAHSAVLLWRDRIRGLRALTATVVGEAVYFALAGACSLLVRGPGQPLNLGLRRALMAGDFSLAVQFLSAFPVVGVVLILLGERRARAMLPAAGSAQAPGPTGGEVVS